MQYYTGVVSSLHHVGNILHKFAIYMYNINNWTCMYIMHWYRLTDLFIIKNIIVYVPASIFRWMSLLFWSQFFTSSPQFCQVWMKPSFVAANKACGLKIQNCFTHPAIELFHCSKWGFPMWGTCHCKFKVIWLHINTINSHTLI